MIATLIFLATYLVIAAGRVPGWHIDRAGAALLGAALMVASGVLTLEQAYAAVDADTLVLLFGMMIVVANLRLSGFFRLVNAFVVRRARHPLLLLLAVVLVSGLLSALLVNDTICLVMTPLVLEVVLALKRRPLPYLLAIAMAANIGSVATITGNPQNMIIGTLSGLPYGAFAGALWPVAAVGLLLATVLIALAFPREFLVRGGLGAPALRPPRVNVWLAGKSALVLVAMVAAFFLGVPPAEVAFVGGAYLLLTRRVKVAKIYLEIDWPLLVMFAGLFVVVGGLEHAVLTPARVAELGSLGLDRLPVLALLTAALSNLVSNVPAVLLLKPFVAPLADPQAAWLGVAMASTLAGNFTLLGSVANLIVAQRARSFGVSVGFWAYFAVGAPLTVLSIAAGVCLLGR